MSLNRFYRPFFESSRSIDHLFNRELNKVFSNWNLHHPNRLNAIYEGPSVNVFDNAKETKVQAELPGLKKEDINVSIRDQYLSISGENKSDQEYNQDDIKIAERSFGKFTRTFQLDANSDLEGIQAKYENGILEVTVPKKEPTETPQNQKQIEIS